MSRAAEDCCCRRVRPRARAGFAGAVPLVLVLCGTVRVAAQPVADDPQAWTVRIAADERVLWLAQVGRNDSVLFYREAGGRFSLGRRLSGLVADMAALDGEVLLFFGDGGIYRCRPSDPSASPQADLPGQQAPVDVFADEGRIYAIVPSPAAAHLARSVPSPDAGGPVTTQPFEPGDAPLSIVGYDGRAWTGLSPCPPNVPAASRAGLPPRIAVARSHLLLFWNADARDHIHFVVREIGGQQWRTGGTFGVSNLTGFWPLSLGKVQTLAAAHQDISGRAAVTAFRLLGSLEDDPASAWVEAKLQLSQPPAGVHFTDYRQAFGFGQHLGLLAADAAGEHYLQFARLGEPPAEPTLRVRDEIAGTRATEISQWTFQLGTLLLLLLVFTGLFTIRRNSMVQVVHLPPGFERALHLQRLAAWLIDFTPFTYAAAAALRLSWREAFASLTGWALTAGIETSFPDPPVLMWWGLSCGGYVLYSLIMESLTARTVGKVLLRCQLLSESGGRPAFWQILARNALRLLELMPPFWVFAMLVVLSRNRQRLGDIFARTVVVRRVRRADRSTGRGVRGEDRKPRPPDRSSDER